MVNTIDFKFNQLRKIIKLGYKSVIHHISSNHLNRNTPQNQKFEICIFCGSAKNLTKEHVIPKWVFANRPEKFFNTDVNQIKQFYIKTTIPVCNNCNNNLLGSIEKYIANLFAQGKDYFSDYEKHNIIRWLEIIEYKFQVLDIRRKFKSSKKYGYIHFLGDYSISVLRNNTNYSASKVLSQLRNAYKRIGIKSKKSNKNSLVVFKSKNTGFDFFHSIENFIYLEIPELKTAVFYFYSKTFETEFEGYHEAIELIKKNYDSTPESFTLDQRI